MKNKRFIRNIFGIISLLMLAYCLFAYIFLQSRLTMELPELTTQLRTIANLTVPALLIAGLYHLFLLVNALKTLKGKFLNSVYIVLVILSGATLLSDLTLLSDIGKEYPIWDVTPEWLLLYAFTALHILVNIWGLIYAQRNYSGNIRLFQQLKSENDTLFLTINHVALLTGLTGIFGIIFAALQLYTPAEYVPQLTIMLAGLALFPLILFVVYWIIKLGRKPLTEWLDEKQVADTALGALISAVITIPLYVFISVVDLTNLANLQISFWILAVFFTQLSAISTVVIARNR